MTNYDFQRSRAKELGLGKSVLNVGCKEDPANLSYEVANITNLDLMDYDIHTDTHLKTLRNFIQADFLTWTPDKQYEVLILGEFLEHCDLKRFHETIHKCYEVLAPEGRLIITTPYDPRKKEGQHDREDKYFEIREGIVSWHVLLITEEMLRTALTDAGFRIDEYDRTSFTGDYYWHLLCCTKIS
jgi:predicted SAM-dependent methyltransferase